MFPRKCKAILKTISGEILETGFASYSPNSQSLEFTASFVPMLQINSETKVICTENEHTTHIFTGKVYLSSPKLLRIVSLKCIFVREAEKYLSSENIINAELNITNEKKFLFIKTSKKECIPCKIHSVSLNEIYIECNQLENETIEKASIVIFKPIFSKPAEFNLTLGEKSLKFGNHPKILYKIENIDKQTELELCSYIRSHQLSILEKIDLIDEAAFY